MRIIVCGGRNYNNVAHVWRELDRIHEQTPISAVMHGGANGVDAIARDWAVGQGVTRYICKADWVKHGKAAGPLRNARMMEWQPDFVVAFPGGKGTQDCVAKARVAGIKVIEIT